MRDPLEEQRLLDLYLADIAQYPPLAREEELALLVRIERGEDAEDAQRALVEANLQLVVDIAKTHETTGSRLLLDVIQDGNLGLMHAVQRFDRETDPDFPTYASNSIHEAIAGAPS